MERKLIGTAPLNRDLELAVIDSTGTQVVAFPCRRLSDNDSLDTEPSKRAINPTHWHDWSHN
jgi:hypothetical protein